MTKNEAREGAWRARGDSARELHDQPFQRPTQEPADVAPLRRSSNVEKLKPDQNGALRHAERFGGRLVCLRHRTDPESEYRLTIGEIVDGARARRLRSAARLGIAGRKATEQHHPAEGLDGVWLRDRSR